MDLHLPRVFADENAKNEAVQTAKEIGAVAAGFALFGVIFAGVFVLTGANNRAGGA